MPSFGFGGEVRGLPFSTVKAGPCGTGKNHPRCAPVFLPVALPVEARHGVASEIRMTPCPPVKIYSYVENPDADDPWGQSWSDP